MVSRNQNRDTYEDSPAGAELSEIFPLLEEGGNRDVLQNWIDGHDSYTLVEKTGDIEDLDFDCLICDTDSIWEHKEALKRRKQAEDTVLPYALVVDERDEKRIRDSLRNDHPDLWRTINAIIAMPIAEYRLDDRIQTLMQMRSQSLNLHEQQKQLQAIRDEHAGHGVVITDREGTIKYVNAAFENQSGYDSQEVLGKNPRILKSGAQDEAFYEDLWETILAGEVWQGEVINERKDGEHYVLNQTIAPVTDTDGEIERFIAVNHETTQLKDLERSLRHQREQLEILNRVLRHDIRNDLHVMLGWAEILETHVDEDGAEYLGRIKRSGEQIIELTEVAKEIGEEIFADEDPDLQATDLMDILEEEVQKRQATFETASIEISESPEEGPVVWANEMLSSLVRNLINNAVQHNNSDHPTVDVSVTENPDTVRIRIADNGPGIPDEQKDEIFDKERKGLDSTGTGMGLFLVKSLVEVYDGRITVRDNTPRGTVFTITLRRVDPNDRSEDQQ